MTESQLEIVDDGDTVWRPTLNDHIEDVFDRVARLAIGKQADYGPRNISHTPFGSSRDEVLRAILVRLGDKTARLANLIETGRIQAAANEPAEDTAYDIMGYGAILALVLTGRWPGVDV